MSVFTGRSKDDQNIIKFMSCWPPSDGLPMVDHQYLVLYKLIVTRELVAFHSLVLSTFGFNVDNKGQK
jgi:hypothetical protein